MQQSEATRTHLKRTRIAIACMHCRRRRIKCSGGNPCSSCVKLGRACVYECGPKKPRISHKGVVTTLKAENQRLRADLQGLRMFSGLAGVSLSSCSASQVAAPKAEELPFVDAYLTYEDRGLFHIVGRSRFDAVLSALRGKKGGRVAASMPTLSREDAALYFAMLAMGASLRRQEVSAMSYAARVRFVLAESFDAPSETMVRVALLLAVLHGSRLEFAKEACYLSTALQMLALLHRVTGKAAPRDLVATAGAICSLADGPLPFATPRDLACNDPLITLACRLTRLAGALMHLGSDQGAMEPIDFDDLAATCADAVRSVAGLRAAGVTVPAAHATLAHGLQAIVLFRLGRTAAAVAAVRRCIATAAPGAAHGARADATASPRNQCWLHPVMAFVLRHVAVLAATLGIHGGDQLGKQVHQVAMSWQRAALYFRGLQSELRAFDDSLRARLTSSSPSSSSLSFTPGVAHAQAAAPVGGSPPLHGSVPSHDAKPHLGLDMCFDLVRSGTSTAAPAPSAQAKDLFSFVQMVTLSLGKPFNTCRRVLEASAAFTRALVGVSDDVVRHTPRASSPSSCHSGCHSVSSGDAYGDVCGNACGEACADACCRPVKRQRTRRYAASTPAASPVAVAAVPSAMPMQLHDDLSLPSSWEPMAPAPLDLLDGVSMKMELPVAAPAAAGVPPLPFDNHDLDELLMTLSSAELTAQLAM